MAIRKRLCVVAALAALAGATPAFGQAGGKLPEGVTAEMVERGKAVFAKDGLCYACHGAEGEGTIGPNLTDSEWLHSKGSYEEIVASVTKGFTKEEAKKGVPMPPKGGSSINDEDVKAVSAYVWTLSHASKGS